MRSEAGPTSCARFVARGRSRLVLDEGAYLDQAIATSFDSQPRNAPAAAVVGGVSVRSVERALLAHRGPSIPTTATCRPSSSSERVTAPFGHTRRPLFTCELTATGEHASYVVQVLGNGCYIAERPRPGRAVDGCGADKS